MEPRTAPKQPQQLTPIGATVGLLERGHSEMLPRLRELLAQHPEVYRYVGDLGKQAQRAWAELIGGPDDLLKESLVLFADEIRKTLVGENASVLEQLAAERIAAGWMEREYFRTLIAQQPAGAEASKAAELCRRRFDEADRRYERALKTLAEIKRLLPRTIQIDLLHSVHAESPTRPILPQAHADQPPPSNAVISRDIDAAENVNRINRINGHNRLTKVLVPADAGVGG